MSCEVYKQPLRDAAASGQLSAKLREHLASCVSCRSAFAEEQALFEVLDSGLQVLANAEVPATLIPRIHVALNNHRSSQSRSAKWLFVGAAFAAAVVVLFVVRFSRRESVPPDKNVVAQTPALPFARPPEVRPTDLAGVRPAAQRPNNVDAQKRHSAQLQSSANADVLVPDEERVAFARFLAHASLRGTNHSIGILVAPQAPEESVQIPRLEIANLGLKPLDGSNAEQTRF